MKPLPLLPRNFLWLVGAYRRYGAGWLQGSDSSSVHKFSYTTHATATSQSSSSGQLMAPSVIGSGVLRCPRPLPTAPPTDPNRSNNREKSAGTGIKVFYVFTDNYSRDRE
jgi:hypothetical protein